MTVLAHDLIAGAYVSLHAIPARSGSQVNHFVVFATELEPQRQDFRYLGQDRTWADLQYQAARHGLMAAEAAERDTVA